MPSQEQAINDEISRRITLLSKENVRKQQSIQDIETLLESAKMPIESIALNEISSETASRIGELNQAIEQIVEQIEQLKKLDEDIKERIYNLQSIETISGLQYAPLLLNIVSSDLRYGSETLKESQIPLAVSENYKILQTRIELLKNKISNFKKLNALFETFETKIKSISADNEFRSNLNIVLEELEEGKDDSKLNNDKSLYQFIELINESLQNAKADFEPEDWHQIADAAIQFLNGLKGLARALGFGGSDVSLFKKQQSDANNVNTVIEQLQQDIAQSKPNSEQSKS